MDADVKLYIKPGIFEAQSKLNDYSLSYKGLHSEESLSYSEEIINEIIEFLEFSNMDITGCGVYLGEIIKNNLH